MRRLLILLALTFALAGCTNENGETDTVTLYDVNGAAVAHYKAHAVDVHFWGGIGNHNGVSLTTTAGQHVDWSGAYLAVEEK